LGRYRTLSDEQENISCGSTKKLKIGASDQCERTKPYAETFREESLNTNNGLLGERLPSLKSILFLRTSAKFQKRCLFWGEERKERGGGWWKKWEAQKARRGIEAQVELGPHQEKFVKKRGERS